MTNPACLVLVHGAELGSWVWDRLRSELERPSLAVDLPGRAGEDRSRQGLGMEDAIQAVAADARRVSDSPIVLVVHSFSGVLAPGIVEALGGAVRAVVWLGATVPEQGRSWVDLQPMGQRAVLRLLYRVRPGGALSPRKQTIQSLANDLGPEEAGELVDRRVPEVPRYLTDPVRRASLPPDVDSHYVELLQDRAVGQSLVAASVARLHATERHQLDAGHLPMLSKPRALATLLNEIAAAQDAPVPNPSRLSW